MPGNKIIYKNIDPYFFYDFCISFVFLYFHCLSVRNVFALEEGHRGQTLFFPNAELLAVVE